MKCVKRVILCAAVFLMIVCPAFAGSLPEALGEWRLVSEHVTRLSAELGSWTSAAYSRAAPPGRVDFQLTKGPGPGKLLVPAPGGKLTGKDAIEANAYETLSVGGRPAVLETSALLGLALAVDLDERTLMERTLTFEAKGLTREELLAFAENMIRELIK